MIINMSHKWNLYKIRQLKFSEDSAVVLHLLVSWWWIVTERRAPTISMTYYCYILDEEIEHYYHDGHCEVYLYI